MQYNDFTRGTNNLRSNDVHLHYVNDENVEIVEKDLSTPSNDVIDDDVLDCNEVAKKPKKTSPKPFTSPLSFNSKNG